MRLLALILAVCTATAVHGRLGSQDLHHLQLTQAASQVLRALPYYAGTPLSSDTITPPTPQVCLAGLPKTFHSTFLLDLLEPGATAAWAQAAAGQDIDTCLLAFRWDELEPQPGLFNSTMLTAGLWKMHSEGRRCAVFINVVDTSFLTIPADLRDPSNANLLRPDLTFLSDEFITRLALMTLNFLPVLQEYDAFFLGLGTAVDQYIANVLGQDSAAAENLTAGMGAIRTTILREWAPNATLSVSVSVDALHMASMSYEDKAWYLIMAATLDAAWLGMNFAVGDVDVMSPANVAGALSQMLGPAAPECVNFEFSFYPSGYASGGLINATAAAQAQALSAMATVFEQHSSRVQFVSIGPFADLPQSVCQMLVQRSKLTAREAEFACTLGVVAVDGTPKPSLAAAKQILSMNSAQ